MLHSPSPLQLSRLPIWAVDQRDDGCMLCVSCLLVARSGSHAARRRMSYPLVIFRAMVVFVAAAVRTKTSTVAQWCGVAMAGRPVDASGLPDTLRDSKLYKTLSESLYGGTCFVLEHPAPRCLRHPAPRHRGKFAGVGKSSAVRLTALTDTKSVDRNDYERLVGIYTS